ncbi:MAG: PaaI family thioesterase [Halioglobus sp.]
MDLQQKLDALNEHAPGFIKMMGGKIIELDPDSSTCTFEFNIGKEFCHSVDIVQGGFTTAMLDAAMSHAVFATMEGISNLSSLEIKTSYMGVTRAGKLRAVGKVVKSSYKTAFLEGHMYNEEGELTATTSSVAKIVRPK